jgi:hypothetical protein
MSHDDDFIGQLEDYLEAFDALTPLPDRVRDAIHAELPTARQVRPWPGFLRLPIMLSNASARARGGLAAAAVVAGLVLGAAFLNTSTPGNLVGGGPTPTPTRAPSSVPTPSPSMAASIPTLAQATYVACDPTDTGKSCLAPGTYQLSGYGVVWPATVTVDVPAGWFEWDPANGSPGSADALLVQGGPPDHAGSGWGILFGTVGDVSRDPCDPSKGVIPAAQVDTPQKLAAAMAAWPKFTATTPRPVTVDGHSGLEFQLTSTNESSCANSGSVFPWHATSGAAVNVYPMINSNGTSDPGTFEIVDTGRGLLLIRMTDFPQTSPTELSGGVAMDPTRHAADQTALHAILDSIRITSTPGDLVGGGPTPTPRASIAPSPTPTPAASVAAQSPSLAAGTYVACAPADTGRSCLAPGTYQLSGGHADWPVTVTLDVPAGWFEWQAGTGFDGVLVADPPTFDNSGWGVMFTTVGDVARDPCDGTKGSIPAADVDTPQKLAVAMSTWPGFTATALRPITVDGHSGMRLDMTSRVASSCNVTDPSGWLTTAGFGVDLYPMTGGVGTAPGRFEIVDTGHGLLVIRTTEFSATSPNETEAGIAMDPTRHAADQTALHAILDSIRITDWPASP